MKKCINCGNIENNNAAACSKCGGPLMKNSKTCWNCGAEIEEDVAFCNYCGAAMGTETPPAPYLYERTMLPEEKSKGKGMVIALVSIVCVLLIVCIVLAVYLFSNKDNSVNNGNENDTSQQQDQSDNTEPQEEEKPKVSTYQLFKRDYTWVEANSSALQMGGNLVCVNSAEEFNQVCAMADAQNLKMFWMGASIDYVEQSWSGIKWKNGDDMTYTKWFAGEPSGYDKGTPELYLMAFKVKGVWYFNDGANDTSAHYSGKMGYIVEFEE